MVASRLAAALKYGENELIIFWQKPVVLLVTNV